jgi:hypothetical protein
MHVDGLGYVSKVDVKVLFGFIYYKRKCKLNKMNKNKMDFMQG